MNPYFQSHKFANLLFQGHHNQEVHEYIPFLGKQTIQTFKIMLDKKYICVVFNKENKLIGFGLTWPSLADALKKSNGRALPFGFLRWLHAIKHPNAVEQKVISNFFY